MVKGERFVLKQHFNGLPKHSDFEHVKEDLGPLQDGEIAFETEFISVDPYQRPYSGRLQLPVTMIGSLVANERALRQELNLAGLLWRRHITSMIDRNAF